MTAIYTSNLTQHSLAFTAIAVSTVLSAFQTHAQPLFEQVKEISYSFNRPISDVKSKTFDQSSFIHLEIITSSTSKLKSIAKENLLKKIDQYRYTPTLNGLAKEASLITAIEFAKNLPGDIPLPKLMVNDDAELGFYWDLDGIYVDVDIEENETFSIYFKKTNGEKGLIDEVNVNAITVEWMEQNLGSLFYS